MAPCNLSAQSKATIEEGIHEAQTGSYLHQDAPMISNSIHKHQASEPTCEGIIPFSSEPELEPDGKWNDVNADTCHSNTKTHRVMQVSSDFGEDDWEPIAASSIQRQETDENWPTWNPSADNGPPGTFYRHSNQQAPEEAYEPAPGTWVQASEEAYEPAPGTWVVPYVSGGAYATEANGPSVETACTWLPVAPSMQEHRSRRRVLLKRPKRESPLDIAKRQLQQNTAIKFCPWCGGKCGPSFKFCMYCGEAYDSVRK
jgi:hypothetical protein